MQGPRKSLARLQRSKNKSTNKNAIRKHLETLELFQHQLDAIATKMEPLLAYQQEAAHEASTDAPKKFRFASGEQLTRSHTHRSVEAWRNLTKYVKELNIPSAHELEDEDYEDWWNVTNSTFHSLRSYVSNGT